VGFFSGNLDIFLQLAERTCVGRLVLFEKLKNFLDSLGVQLFMDCVEVLALISPKVDLSDGIRVLTAL
jgi:hypothetical protein